MENSGHYISKKQYLEKTFELTYTNIRLYTTGRAFYNGVKQLDLNNLIERLKKDMEIKKNRNKCCMNGIL